MSRRRRMALRLEAYGEVRAILAAMKNVALAELHRLAGLHDNQRQAMDTMERAAADFIAHHAPRWTPGARRACLVIGSERGFCGEFNAPLAEAALERHRAGEQVLVIGSRLRDKLADATRRDDVIPAIAGAGVAEELSPTLERAVAWLERVQAAAAPDTLSVAVLHHDPDGLRPVPHTVLPLPAGRPAEPQPYPPLLNLPPERFLAEFANQALLLALHEAFSVSLMAENRRRLEHMEGALRRLDAMTATLARRLNGYRQEEITQEIEVMMLSAEAIAEDTAAMA